MKGMRYMMCVTPIVLFFQGICESFSLLPEEIVCCPHETVVLTCSANLITSMEWTVDQYFTSDPIVYTANPHDEEDYVPRQRQFFISQLTNFIPLNVSIATLITSSIETNCSDIKNGTVVTCQAFCDHGSSETANTTLYHADVPQRKSSVLYPMNQTLELGEMFDGGGVPIDHYIIQLDNGTQLKTTNSTFSLDIMYNTTLSVNISAHNCAGYSPFFPLLIVISIPGDSFPMEVMNTTLNISVSTEHTTDFSNPTILNNGSTTEIKHLFQHTFLLSLTISSSTITIVVLLGAVCLVIFFMHQNGKKNKRCDPEIECDMEENTAYGVTMSEPDYNMENNPLYEMKSCPPSSETLATTHVYECVNSFK